MLRAPLAIMLGGVTSALASTSSEPGFGHALKTDSQLSAEALRFRATSNGHGALHKIFIASGERLSVDNGHLVAWSPNLEMRVGWAARGSAWRSLASGEGLMCHFEGPGEVFVATHGRPRQTKRND